VTTEHTDVKLAVEMGLLDGEVTEHCMRKVMECLVSDFPQTPS